MVGEGRSPPTRNSPTALGGVSSCAAVLPQARLCAVEKEWIERKGGKVHTGAPVAEIVTNEDGSVKHLRLRSGEIVVADEYVSAGQAGGSGKPIALSSRCGVGELCYYTAECLLVSPRVIFIPKNDVASGPGCVQPVTMESCQDPHT